MKNTNGNDLEGHTYRLLQTPMKEFSRCQAAQCTKALPVQLINNDGPGAKGHDTMPAGVIPAGFINKSQMIRKHTQEGCETTQNGKQCNYPHRTRWDALSLSLCLSLSLSLSVSISLSLSVTTMYSERRQSLLPLPPPPPQHTHRVRRKRNLLTVT